MLELSELSPAKPDHRGTLRATKMTAPSDNQIPLPIAVNHFKILSLEPLPN